MSYVPVNQDRLKQFLVQLGRSYRKPARIYLVGGTELLYNGLKAGTKDIDLAVELALPNDPEFTRILIGLRNQLQVAADYRRKFDAFITLVQALPLEPPATEPTTIPPDPE